MTFLDMLKVVVGSATLAVGAGAASASTLVDYTFHNLGGQRVVCVAPGDSRLPGATQCTDPQSVSGSIPGAPDVLVSSSSGLARFDLGFGAGTEQVDDKVQPGENVKLEFLGQVPTLVSLRLAYFSDQPQQLNIFDSANQDYFSLNIVVNSPTDFWAATGATVGDPFPYSATDAQFLTEVQVGASGSVFGIEPRGNSDGFFVAGATFEFESEHPSEIPVPPAAPLLGGALVLMLWRARRARR